MPNESAATREITERMQRDGAPEIVIQSFLRHVDQLRAGARGLIPEEEIQPVLSLPDLKEVQACQPQGRLALAHTVVIQLNGGLGTGMGLDKAKSLIPVKNGLTFLDIIARQMIHIRQTTGIPLPLLLMNSRNTDEDTRRALAAYSELQAGQKDIPLTFLQHRIPKLDRATQTPIRWPADPELEWCPPGHGDLYQALVTTGLLRRLLDRGITYAFISNSDNLGATLDLGILGYFAENLVPFLMEVTPRTEADRKGGHLAERRGGGLLLRELAQCPPEQVARFQDIRRYDSFNTNNIWLNLKALDGLLHACGNLPELSLIINQKTVDPRDADSPPVIQLETAMGSAISLFPDARALRVPRSRFSPVKTTSDLLVLWSDACELTPEHHLALRPERQGRPPTVELDPSFYRILDDFQVRFDRGIPSLIDCESMVVQGDIRFGPGVKCVGSVRLRNRSPQPVTIVNRTCGPTEEEIDVTAARL